MEDTFNEMLEIATTYEELGVIADMMWYDYTGYRFKMKRSGLNISKFSPVNWDECRVHYTLENGGKRSSQIANLSRNVEIVK